MAPSKNLSLIFKEIPTGPPEAHKHLVIEDRPLDLDTELSPNQLLLEHLYHSLDPYMRGRLRDPKIKSYSPAYQVGQPLYGAAIAKVVKSTSSDFQVGDNVQGAIPIQQYSIFNLADVNPKSTAPSIRKVNNPYNLTDLRLFLHPLGVPGLTAYSSLYDIGQPKSGETIFISSAAGAVGQIVGQLAKHEGLRVIGSVGSDEKLDFITTSLGFDGGFNYKKETDFDAALRRLAPAGLDIYYENVGGAQLEAALNAMNDYGRVVACGMISQFNTPMPERYGVRNLWHVVSKRLTMRGFIVGDANMGPRYVKDLYQNVGRWISEGSFKARIDEMGTIEEGDRALVGMLRGENFGKAVINMKTK